MLLLFYVVVGKVEITGQNVGAYAFLSVIRDVFHLAQWLCCLGLFPHGPKNVLDEDLITILQRNNAPTLPHSDWPCHFA